ncbi:TniQ family protein [Cohnella lupini]|uniref:TniQ protein n=1 Tax=Cohnella lupini TaxID=1294267 RepID=A0A3D9HTP9_9BACL|nr:TniQ family protein [Cohnella lupini]RED52894.1 TniQ protein [Cohnella lupini]
MLPNRPMPHVQESIYSYFIRCQQANGYPSVHWVYDVVRVSYLWNYPHVVYQNKELGDNLKLLLGERIVSNLSYISRSDESNRVYNIQLNNLTLPHFALEKNKVKVCVCCIKDFGYLNNLWNFLFVTTCPIHRCKLINTCSECNKPFRWHKNILFGCQCGTNWNLFNIERYIDPSEMLLSSIFYRYFGYSKILVNEQGLPEEFNRLTLPELISLISLVAWLYPKNQYYFTMNHFSHLSLNETHILLMSALNVFLDWPNNFWSFLDSLDKKRRVPFNNRIETELEVGMHLSHFGDFYSKLYSLYSKPSFQFVFDAFENYLAADFRGGYLNGIRKKFRSTQIDKAYYTSHEFTTKYGLSGNTLERLVSKGLVEGKIELKGKRRIILGTSSSVDMFMEDFKQSLSVEESSLILGLHKNSVRKLIESKVLTEVRGPNTDQYMKWRVKRESIKLLLDIFASATSIVNYNDEDFVSFNGVFLRGSNKNKLTVIDLVEAVISGHLKVFNSEDKKIGLKQYCFRKSDIDILLESKCEKYFDEVGYTQNDAAKILGIDSNRLNYLLELSLIDSVKTKANKIIKKDELLHFDSQYILLSKLAKLLQTAAGTLKIQLSQSNIYPINTDNEHKYHCYVYQLSNSLKKFIGEKTALL